MSRTEIALRHTNSPSVDRGTVSRVIREVKYRGQPSEIITMGGRWFRVFRRQGLGRYINVNRPLQIESVNDLPAAAAA